MKAQPLSDRAYQGAADLTAMITLAQTLRAGGQIVYPIAADLYEELAFAEVQATARLWQAGPGQLVGFAYVSPYNNLVNVFDARHITPAIETELVDWASAAMQRRNHEKGREESLDASALESDLERIAFLTRHGFETQSEASILMARPLEQPLPEAQLTPGFIIRPMGGEKEIEAYVALHRAAFGSDFMTVDYRRTIMQAPGFIPELDLVAVAPNGDLAAFCVCQIFADDSPRAGGQKEGWTDPLGTHPTYQRLGLARALLLTGMHRLQSRCIDTALLGTSSENHAMQHVAAAVGFRLASRTLFFCKTV